MRIDIILFILINSAIAIFSSYAHSQNTFTPATIRDIGNGWRAYNPPNSSTIIEKTGDDSKFGLDTLCISYRSGEGGNIFKSFSVSGKDNQELVVSANLLIESKFTTSITDAYYFFNIRNSSNTIAQGSLQIANSIDWKKQLLRTAIPQGAKEAIIGISVNKPGKLCISANNIAIELNQLQRDSLEISKINYRTWGNKENPAIVLLHGNGLDLNTWSNVAPELARKYFVIAYDQRGHGQTVYDGFDYSMDSQVGDLNVLLQHLKVDKANLIGSSFGARIALAYAYHYPSRVNKIVSEDMDMSLRYNFSPAQCVIWGKSLKEIEPTVSSYSELEANFKTITNGNIPLQYRQLSDGRFQHTFPSTIWGCVANASNLITALQSYKGPILFVKASTGSALGKNGVTEIKKERPDAKIIEIPDSFHVIHSSDRPRADFVKIIFDFL